MAEKKSEKIKTKTVKKSTKKNADVATERKKAKSEGDKATAKRVLLAERKPIDFFYVAGQSTDKKLEYIEIQQVLNDKFNGKILQQQFFPVAESSERIITLNRLLIDRAVYDATVNAKIRFLVQVSAKWFSTPAKINEFVNFVAKMGEYVVLCFDSVTLVKAGQVAKDVLEQLKKERFTKILLDNVEFQNLGLLIGYHPDYIRLDARLIDKTDEKYVLVLRFMRDYCKAQSIRLCVRNVKDDAMKNWLLLNGVNVVEGNCVYTPKKNVSTIREHYKL